MSTHLAAIDPADVRLTLRQPAEADGPALRRHVADALTRAAGRHGTTTATWTDDVDRLYRAVIDLICLRRHGESEARIAALREQVSVAMLMVIPVYAEAQQILSASLADAPRLRTLQATLSHGGRSVVVDPWLHRPVTETVQEVLEARTSPVRLAAAC